MSFDTDTESYAGDDPTGAGDTGVGYGSTGVDTAGNPTDGSVLSRTGFKNAMGITDTNPFGFKGPFSAIFGINPKNIDYSNIFGPDEREALIDQRFGLYSNPLSKGFDILFS